MFTTPGPDLGDCKRCHLSSIGLDNVDIYVRGGPLSSDFRIVNLHPKKSTHWVCYIKETYFDRYGLVCPKELYKFIIKRNRLYLYSEYQIQKNDSFCASYCSYIISVKTVLGMDFRYAVLKFWDQMI